MGRSRVNFVKIKLAVILLGMLVPLIVYLIFYNFFMIRAVNDKIMESNRRTLQLYCMEIEDELSTYDNILIDFITNNINFKMLRVDTGSLNAHLYAHEIIGAYASWINTSNSIGAIYIVSEANSIFRMAYTPAGYNLTLKNEINDYLKELIASKVSKPGWFCVNLGEYAFLCRLIQSSGVYAFFMVDLGKLNLPQNNPQLSGGGSILFHRNGVPVTYTSWTEEQEITFHATGGDYYITGKKNKYLAVEAPIQKIGLTAALLVPYNGPLSNLSAIQLVLLAFSLSTVFLIPLSYLLLYRTFTRPMASLLKTIDEICQGNMDAKLASEYKNKEFNHLADAFNNMMDQVISWKNSYLEKELAERQAHLQYLQMQIRPHFYLNCLKNIYGMAQGKKYDDIQQTILYLSQYLRHMIQDKSSLIPLGEELEHVRDLLKIYSMGVANSPIYKEEIDVSHLRYLVPPISVLTFVENSMKHAAGANETLTIRVATRILPNSDGDILNITISDNGDGFDPDMEKRINLYEVYRPLKGHVGIYNLIQRLRFLYGEQAGMMVSNKNGAQVDLYLPVHLAEKKNPW